jgi:beta-lactamase class A
MEQIAAEAKGRVGATALLVETGQRWSVHGGERFPMQSVYKFPIAMAVLHLVDSGKLTLSGMVSVSKSDLVPSALHSPIRDEHPEGVDLSVRELIRFAVAESDGTASDVLMRLAGGAQSVEGYLRVLGISGIAIATTEKEMSTGPMVQYRNWATPDGMADLLGAFQEGRGLSAGSRGLLMDVMVGSHPGPKRMKGLLPAGTVVAHKTGTSGTSDGLTRATNDVGIITLPDGRHLAVAVFVADSRAAEEVREAVIARMALAAWKACE